MSQTASLPRMYNQLHRPRPAAPGRRRVSVYVSWSYPAESGRELRELDNRYSTMFEVRRVQWPRWEWANDPSTYDQGIAGSLELFFRTWMPFQQLVGEVTGYHVPVFQRVDQAGYFLPLDERVLADTDTLLVFGLDHMITEQRAAPEEIEAVRSFLGREGTWLVIGPHHDVGVCPDLAVREMEYRHHGDPLVPRQQRFGLHARSILEGLGIPVENRYGLHPARVPGTDRIAPLSIAADLDTHGLLEGVTTLNYHPHLPHYAVTSEEGASQVRVLARQPIDLTAPPHPFTVAGNRELNALVWAPPSGERAGDVLVADSTIFNTLFGGDQSLERFWKNLVTV